jgi:hypothetical protein
VTGFPGRPRNSGCNPGRGKWFSFLAVPTPTLGPIQLPAQWIPGGKISGLEADHVASGVEVNSLVSAPHGCGQCFWRFGGKCCLLLRVQETRASSSSCGSFQAVAGFISFFSTLAECISCTTVALWLHVTALHPLHPTPPRLPMSEDFKPSG